MKSTERAREIFREQILREDSFSVGVEIGRSKAE